MLCVLDTNFDSIIYIAILFSKRNLAWWLPPLCFCFPWWHSSIYHRAFPLSDYIIGYIKGKYSHDCRKKCNLPAPFPPQVFWNRYSWPYSDYGPQRHFDLNVVAPVHLPGVDATVFQCNTWAGKQRLTLPASLSLSGHHICTTNVATLRSAFLGIFSVWPSITPPSRMTIEGRD